MRVKEVRIIAREEKDPPDLVGMVMSRNDDGTHEVLLRSGNTLNLINASEFDIYPGMIVDITQNGRGGRKYINGRSTRTWLEPTVMYG